MRRRFAWDRDLASAVSAGPIVTRTEVCYENSNLPDPGLGYEPPLPNRPKIGGWLAASGAGEGIRTPDPLITNQMLYQLSYASRQRNN